MSEKLWLNCAGIKQQMIMSLAVPKPNHVCGKRNEIFVQLEGRANLRRMIQEIPLTDEEMPAVGDGIAALDNLTDKLADTPTPRWTNAETTGPDHKMEELTYGSEGPRV